MIDFDEELFNNFLDNREIPEETLKNITVDNIKINNVPVIEHKEGSVEFTIGFDTSAQIYKLLANNKGKKEINFIKE